MKKMLLGGLVGGAVVFVWGAVSHMVFQIGDMGLSELPQEAAVVAALKDHVPRAGLYAFPGMGDEATEEQMEAWQARYAAGPVGLLVYHPQGSDPMSPRRFGVQFACSVLGALIAALMLSRMSGAAYGTRVLLVTLLGVFAWLTVNVPHWNWYGFPGEFTLGAFLDEGIGWLLAGLVMAGMIKPQEG